MPTPPVRPVTRAELEQVYGADGLRRYPAAELPAVVTDPSARALLTDVGLPDGPGAFLFFGQVPTPLAEYVSDPAALWPDLPDGGAGLVALGYWGATFALDGATGEVYALIPHQPATVDGRPAHRDLHSLLRCQIAFGADELSLLGDLMDPDTVDWCRAHIAGFAEAFPPEELDEDGYPVDEEPDGTAPHPDEVIARLSDKLRQIEPDLLRHAGWESIVQHFRYGY
ncbi:SUKH-4 family immunity protein [Kitasatospora sp. NPDC004614]|uniref:SUKH-4 family immunity protein n=2 Tax=Kitasatospora TaxID=2063 RepID=UPI0036CA99ED